jgi:hypothetical protein
VRVWWRERGDVRPDFYYLLVLTFSDELACREATDCARCSEVRSGERELGVKLKRHWE